MKLTTETTWDLISQFGAMAKEVVVTIGFWL